MEFKPKFKKPKDNSYLDKNEPSTAEITTFVYNKYHSQSIATQRQRLPIFQNRNHILYLLEKYQTLILVGETGSGKSTQIPQYLVEAEWPLNIGICEPRRVAAVALANRVADEIGVLVQSDSVGYAVRFDSCCNNPKIKYMTEGILIRELMADPLLKSYSVIMIDEVHERTLYTDILIVLLRKVLKKRKDLRLVVASATLDAKSLQNYFNFEHEGATKSTSVILSVQGRQFPVEIYYLSEPCPCYIQTSADTALNIHKSKEPGDILIFMPGLEDVEKTSRLLEEHATIMEQTNRKPYLLVLPMHGSLPYQDQLKVFKPAPENTRKVIIATNIAETSITIPGIVHIIDSGLVKIRWYNTDTHTDSLVVVPTSKASADQRAGRAGRIRFGKVYRLYTESYFEKMADATPPEIVRSSLTYTILQLKALGIGNILGLKFPDKPPVKNIKSALEILYALDAIDINCNLTKPLGHNMAEFPLDPMFSKILLNSGDFGCSEEILTIISMNQVQNIFSKPSSGAMIAQARVKKRMFEVAEGDLITYLNVYNGFVQGDMSSEFCQRNFLSYKSMKRVMEIRKRLEKLTNNYGVPVVSCQGFTETICKCLVTGLFPNAAYLHHSGVYKTVRGDIELFISPDSVLYTEEQPQWVIFTEVVHTKKLYMRELTVIKDQWLLDLAPHFYYKSSYGDDN